MANQAGSATCCQILLDRGFLPEGKSGTAIHVAAYNGELECLKMIHQASSNPKILDTMNRDNRTPLQLAVQNNHVAVVKYLLNNKVDSAGKGLTQ